MAKATIKLDGITRVLKAHSKETGSKAFTTQIQYKANSKANYYEYTNSSVIIRFTNDVFNTHANIKLFPDSTCTVFPNTDRTFPRITDDTKIQVFDTRLLLDNIRKLEKNPSSSLVKETKKHRVLDFIYTNRSFTNCHPLNHLPGFFRVDSYHLKTIIRIFSMLQCEETTIFYNEERPYQPIILECELATAVLAPIRYNH
ncbi:hypothetical protein H702_07095 [Streptococcus equinus JB1]|uniref:Uncharacterized protein n=1 Tax=Streptococcus equinus JB1 TaxID=1294274 RepID=A0A091BUJ7_STREI|nr:hypothetical protein [Streptococcus equinus]KFN87422.1 hypothetical protein H702_07095 [Streptococcus equinus JB1]QBX15720.1 hypothetical protein Javan207_0034 [Streptococcus phage Javan207]SFL16177.1 hypothetical protein SAMN02910290_00707 [Streptococcus equinus JB1]